ncbi:MAG TPA: hypothetical protein VKR38_04035 [Usitatibacter sp.]|nr:hypothetical protein [Usitatibacter sp.]
MRRLLAMLLSTLACAGAAAQPAPPANSNAQAKELAQKLGREQSAEGLETIIKTRNWDLLAAYVVAFDQGGVRVYTQQGNKRVPIPKDIEAMMLRYYADDDVGPRLWGLCANFFTCQSRELFDRMLAEHRSGKPRNRGENLGGAMLRSSAPGADAALTQWLGAPDAPTGQWLNSVVGNLGERKYAPAVPVLSSILDARPPGKPGNEAFALGSIQNQQAADALLSRLAVLKRAPPTTEVVNESRNIGMILSQFPATVAIPYARMRAALPEDTRTYAVTWLSKRNDLAAVPDAIVLLGDAATYPGAIHALVETGSLDVWKQARAAVEKAHNEGRMADPQYGYASTTLDEKIANPGKFAADKAAARNESEFQTHLNLLNRDLEEARKVKATSPDGYVSAMREYLDAAAKLAASYPDTFQAKNLEVNSLTALRIDLANFVRFRQKHPREAIEIYETARAKGSEIAGFGIADTLQYDMRDAKGALAEYRKLVKPVPTLPPGAMGNDNLVLQAWAQRWLAAQVALLESGRKFSGALKPEDMAIIVLLMAGPGQSDTFDLAPSMRALSPQATVADRADVARKLNALPTSSFALQASAVLVSVLPDADSILAYLGREDPAGFATACFFAFLEVSEENGQAAYLGIAPRSGARDPLREARARFLKERRIDLTELKRAMRNQR